MKTLIQAAVVTLLAVSTAAGQDLHVPSDYPTIQAAIDAAGPGARILVSQGVYYEQLDLRGKGIEIRGTEGPSGTVVDGGGVRTILRGSNEPPTCRVVGMQFRNGFAVVGDGSDAGQPAGGVTLQNSHAIFSNCVFAANRASNWYAGAAAYVIGGAPTFEDCVFSSNWSSNDSCASAVSGSAGMRLLRCTFFDNTSAVACSGCWTGGITVKLYPAVNTPNGVIEDCRFYANGSGVPWTTQRWCVYMHQVSGVFPVNRCSFVASGGAQSEAIGAWDGSTASVADCTGCGFSTVLAGGGSATNCTVSLTCSDCDHNAVPDLEQIFRGNAIDTDGNGILDSCDCNNDGFVDYDQCRSGVLADFNGNNIPDCCESGTSCVVGNYPVEWRVAEGGNGHWYQLVISGSVTWEAARSASVLRGGHLATPTSLSERNRLVDVASRPEAWIEHCCGLVGGPWLGGYQPADATSASPWRWVTGEPWSWTDWAPGEPNNGLQPNILSISMWGGLPLGSNYFGWADAFATGTSPQGAQYILPLSYLIEWSADCNNDGIVDKGQILQGQLVDADANGVPDVCEIDPCPGDITNGGTVDAADLSILLAAWGTNGQAEFDTDVDGSGLVDGGDLALVLGGWGPCPQ